MTSTQSKVPRPWQRRLGAWLLIGAAGVSAGWGLVEACGFDFSPLLPKRHRELRAPIPFALADELQAMQLPWLLDTATRQALRTQAQRPGPPEREEELERLKRQTEAQEKGLSAAQRSQLKTMRQASDGDAADALGEGLPPAVRLYAAAAVDYKGGRIDMARKRFEQVLALPEAQAKPRAIWAAYSLGRLLREQEPEAAAKAFGLTRSWLLKDADDPLGLALDSLGEEALDLRRSENASLEQQVQSLRLYLEQARLGSQSGLGSLRQLMPVMLRQPELLQRLLALDWGQALVLRLALTEGDDDAGTPPSPSASYPALLQALEHTAQGALREPDRWAALASQQGDLRRAADWSANSSTSLGAWVQAKVALVRGHEAEAADWYRTAVQRMKPASGAQTPTTPLQVRLGLENGLMQVQRGEFLQGLQQLLHSGPDYWAESAYLAERVVTTDELLDWVRKQGSQTFAPASSPSPGYGPPLEQRLRHLLARRLVREGRFIEAEPFFPSRFEKSSWKDGKQVEEVLDLQAQARAYAKAVRSGQDAYTRVGRASELMRAGHIARESGMELMGFELAPDAFIFEGGFELDDAAIPGEPPIPAAELQRANASQPTLARASASRTPPGQVPRFHYRYVAAEHALQAAALVPARSQAYASSLCHASQWVGTRDETFGAEIYARYVHHGALMAWPSAFGNNCPEPDWWGARTLQFKQDVWAGAPWLKRHPIRSLAAAAGLGVLLITVVVQRVRRRRRASA